MVSRMAITLFQMAVLSICCLYPVMTTQEEYRNTPNPSEYNPSIHYALGPPLSSSRESPDGLVTEHVGDEEGDLLYSHDEETDEERGVNCDPPERPENGYLLGEETEVGSVVYVKCHDGFWLSGPTTLTCTANFGTGIWSPDVTRICVKGKTYFDENDTPEINPLQKLQLESVEQSPEEGDGPPFVYPFLPWLTSDNGDGGEKEEENSSLEKETKEETENKRLQEEVTDGLPPFCFDQPETGSCGKSLKRFHFDHQKLECRKFYYSGCGGNENNFPSLHLCNSVCKGKSVIE